MLFHQPIGRNLSQWGEVSLDNLGETIMARAKRIPVSVEDLRKARIRDQFYFDSDMSTFKLLFIRPAKFLITNPGLVQIMEFRSVEEASNKLYRLLVD
jgi:hypothetical protein